jgi:hypothetical protein
MKLLMVNRKRVKGFSVPEGSIILWYGLSTEVPDGFEIYTELNGFFPYGGNAVDLTARGNASHVHSFPADAISWNSGHTHTVPTGSEGGAGTVDTGYGSGSTASPGHSHSVNGSVTLDGAHRHTIGNTGSNSNMPANKKYYYIKAVG